MNLLTHKNKTLTFDNYEVEKIMKKYPTPLYIYSENQILTQYFDFFDTAKHFDINSPLVCFALKSNPNPALLKSLFKAGAGADIVSGGELQRALECGCPGDRIVFSGVGKTEEEIKEGIKSNIYSFNVESFEELEMINDLAKKAKKIARVALRINPKVNAKTHKYISTGYKTHKFGLLTEDVAKFLKKKNKLTNVSLVGLSVHIGSQLTDFKATKKAIQELFELALLAPKTLEFVDVGGGLGVNYERKDDSTFLTQYMETVASVVNAYKKKFDFSPRIVFEPGRFISASSGILLTKVIRTKKSADHNFAIVDGGMNDFVRTSLYQAYHHIVPVKIKGGKKKNFDIVGPICETADSFASNYPIQNLVAGDLIAVLDVGAYGHSMSSTYNMRRRPTEVIIKKDHSLEKFEY